MNIPYSDISTYTKSLDDLGRFVFYVLMYICILLSNCIFCYLGRLQEKKNTKCAGLSPHVPAASLLITIMSSFDTSCSSLRYSKVPLFLETNLFHRDHKTLRTTFWQFQNCYRFRRFCLQYRIHEGRHHTAGLLVRVYLQDKAWSNNNVSDQCFANVCICLNCICITDVMLT